jgi:hypothetical protein
MQHLSLPLDHALGLPGILDRLTYREHSQVFALPPPILPEFAAQVCAFDMIGDGAWRARRTIESIREIKAQFDSSQIPARDVFLAIYSALTEDPDNLMLPLSPSDMLLFRHWGGWK